MPFTPIHMGPGILIKALLQSSFSLMIFGWTQIVMDIQPLVVMLTGEGHLHGFTHTYIGAVLIAVVAGLTGKHLAEFGLKIMGFTHKKIINISWQVVMLSALLGSISHVFIDGIMHADVEPFYPFTSFNPQWQIISVDWLHKVCLYSGLLGAGVYCLVYKIKNEVE